MAIFYLHRLSIWVFYFVSDIKCYLWDVYLYLNISETFPYCQVNAILAVFVICLYFFKCHLLFLSPVKWPVLSCQVIDQFQESLQVLTKYAKEIYHSHKASTTLNCSGQFSLITSVPKSKYITLSQLCWVVFLTTYNSSQ